MTTRKREEREIQEACSQFLALDGWRRIRTDMPQLRGMGVQERGMADDLYIRYNPAFAEFPMLPNPYAEAIWVEWKRRTGKVAAHQHNWHQAERTRGALTLIAGIDFVASVDGFMAWYFDSGLSRIVRDRRKREAVGA